MDNGGDLGRTLRFTESPERNETQVTNTRTRHRASTEQPRRSTQLYPPSSTNASSPPINNYTNRSRDDSTRNLRGGAGPGRASCASGATFSHRQKSSTPLTLMQNAWLYQAL
ncbi:hypothetical protein PUN28_017184 [Cardiocondyla obscurior]|uniref:Uncharacterized protein n=1 Tax=Cardiocondyla obscurior TaxID=286306 RepID=A0AAW2EPW9_9HYME